MSTSRFNSNSPMARMQRRTGMDVARTTSRRASRRALSDEDQRTLRRILETEPDYIDNPIFRERDAERKIYTEAPDIRRPDASWYHPLMDDIGSKSRLPRTTDQVILTGAEERVLFLQFNYARFKGAEIREEVLNSDTRRPTMSQAREMLQWLNKAEELREQIAETNLALVLAMAKRTRMSEVDFADLVSEGNMALLRAIDKFDCARGFKFSTYACRAILKAFSRQGMKLSKMRQRFPMDFDPKMEKSNFLDTRRADFTADAAAEVKRIVEENHAELTDIEKTVIEHRFRLTTATETEVKPLTLEQVGQIIGVTKERVRQIQNGALRKIRTHLEDNFLGEAKLRGENEEEVLEEQLPSPSLN